MATSTQPVTPEVFPDTEVPADAKPVSRVSQILSITSEKDLVRELKKFENSIYERVHPLRVLLAKDIQGPEVVSLQGHMSEVERWRETVVRWTALAKTFVYHCKSDHFIVKREKGISDFDREAYQKKLLAGFIGLEYWLDGLVDSIDSRVNQVKCLLKMDETGFRSRTRPN